jgi:hypothetical protein
LPDAAVRQARDMSTPNDAYFDAAERVLEPAPSAAS